MPAGPTGAEACSVDSAVWEMRVGRKKSIDSNSSWLQRFERWWVIDPRVSGWFGAWDGMCVLALLFVALVTPFEVAFLDSPKSAHDVIDRFHSVGWLFCVNRVVDIIFTIDLVLQFRLMYTDANSIEGVRWVSDADRIVRHYLFGWFPLDFLSILVSIFDIVPLLGGSDNVRDLRVLRVMRVLRLIKLARLLRASRLFRRWETKIAINYSRLNLIKALIYVVMLSHWFACIWGLQVRSRASRLLPILRARVRARPRRSCHRHRDRRWTPPSAPQCSRHPPALASRSRPWLRAPPLPPMATRAAAAARG